MEKNVPIGRIKPAHVFTSFFSPNPPRTYPFKLDSKYQCQNTKSDINNHLCMALP